jgi:hypothetical protein
MLVVESAGAESAQSHSKRSLKMSTLDFFNRPVSDIFLIIPKIGRSCHGRTWNPNARVIRIDAGIVGEAIHFPKGTPNIILP